MCLGKGSLGWWIANIKPGREIFGLLFPIVRIDTEALTPAFHKLPVKYSIVRGKGGG